MKKSESTATKTFSKPLLENQWNEAISEFMKLVNRIKSQEKVEEGVSISVESSLVDRIKQQEGGLAETDIINYYCSGHGISYNTFKKWLNKEQVNKSQENRIRSFIDETFQGCHCHYIKEPAKWLPQILRADHIILEAIWETSENVDQLQNTLQKQAEIISSLEIARKIGRALNEPELSTMDNMTKNVEMLSACKNLVEKLEEYGFAIHIGQVASFKIPGDEGFSPIDLSFIVCVNSISPLRETLNPEDFALVPNFKKAI